MYGNRVIKAKNLEYQEIKMKTKKVNWNIIAIVILILYPLRHVNTGIDLMDAGYSLGNYQYMAVMNETWKLATYLANLIGFLFTKLPFGKYWIGMNIYTGLLTGIMAAVSFKYCSYRFQDKKLLLFIAEIVALSLCWAPAAILYQYMGYFCMSAAAIVLYEGIEKEQTKNYIIAGVILGLSVIARMPNITYMSMIVPVWFAFWLKKEGTFLQLVQKTGWCVAGYLIGLVPGLVWIGIRYGIKAYPDMIVSLFAMTDQATDYKPTSMITAMFDDYFRYSIWLLFFLLYLAVGLLFFHIIYKKMRHTVLIAAKSCYIAGFLVVLRICYGRGMFGFDYQSHFSYYKWITVYLLATIFLCIYLLFARKELVQKRIWACFLLVMIFVTPLGSNNQLYPIINNLFLVAPVSVWLWADTLKPAMMKFPVKAMVYFIGICMTIQSLLFAFCFIFHDEADTQRVKVDIPGSTSTTGMYTTVDKAQDLQELGGYLEQNSLLDSRVILFGNIPAVSYIFDLEPAIYTTWIDLPSNSQKRLEEELKSLSPENVIVIMGKEIQTGEKQALIENWMETYHYECAFRNDSFYIYKQGR